jgi:hypothetical protein
VRTYWVTSAVQTVVFVLQDVEQLRGDRVAQGGQSVLQFRIIDGTRSIEIETGEDALPFLVRYRQML